MQASHWFFMIGGIPTLGKSTIARRVARERGMDFLSADTIARLMFTVTLRAQFPYLHFLRRQNPNQYFARTSPARFVREFRREAHEIWKGVRGVVEKNKAIGPKGLVLEGSAILPECVAKIRELRRWRVIFLTAETYTEVEKSVRQRGLWVTDKKMIPREAACLFALNKYIAESAMRLRMPCVKVAPQMTLLARSRRALKI